MVARVWGEGGMNRWRTGFLGQKYDIMHLPKPIEYTTARVNANVSILVHNYENCTILKQDFKIGRSWDSGMKEYENTLCFLLRFSVKSETVLKN